MPGTNKILAIQLAPVQRPLGMGANPVECMELTPEPAQHQSLLSDCDTEDLSLRHLVDRRHLDEFRIFKRCHVLYLAHANSYRTGRLTGPLAKYESIQVKFLSSSSRWLNFFSTARRAMV